jgi:hypothetical protein
MLGKLAGVIKHHAKIFILLDYSYINPAIAGLVSHASLCEADWAWV